MILAGAAAVLFATLLPLPARAEVYTVELTPTWNAAALRDEDPDTGNSTYRCEIGFDHTLFSYTDPDFGEWSRIGLKFNLSSIPSSATIMNIELKTYVRFPTPATQTVRRATTDHPDQLSCGTSQAFDALAGTGSVYGTYVDWGTAGLKTLALGSPAVADTQARLLDSQAFAVSIVSNSDLAGAMSAASEPDAIKRPRLVVTYSTTPGAPTSFQLASRTTNSLAWSWVENGWAETHNLVRNELGHNQCDAGPRSGIGNPVGCSEGGLAPNTLYTRYPSAVDPEGQTGGATLSASTLIEAPAGVAVTGVGQTSISLVATGPLSNLQRGFSGVKFFESFTSQHSGWNQADRWTVTGVQPNSPLTFSAQARNGDGIETPASPPLTVYTHAAAAAVSGHRATATWFASPEFSFSNAIAWGVGGVQYYRWAWTTSPTYAFTGSEPTWGNAAWRCPTGACSVTADTLTLAATHNQPWYVHVLPFNGDHVSGPVATVGPYSYDAAAPSAPASASLTDNGDSQYTNGYQPLTVSWGDAADPVSGLREYQYAIGTKPGSADVLDFTSVALATNATIKGLKLKNGKKYYAAVRAIDVAGNLGPMAISSGLLANTADPIVFDRQNGDGKSRREAGAEYDVDFRRAASGPKLRYAQYAVYSKSKLRGERIVDWTTIFKGSRNEFTDNWTVNFAGLREGVNYVSVRVQALDGRMTVARDVFRIVKDTSPAPSIKGLYQATFNRGQPVQEMLIVGKGFKRGARVYVGSQRATNVTLNRFGQLTAVFDASQLSVGRYDLRVVNPNGLKHSRKNRVYIIQG